MTTLGREMDHRDLGTARDSSLRVFKVSTRSGLDGKNWWAHDFFNSFEFK